MTTLRRLFRRQAGGQAGLLIIALMIGFSFLGPLLYHTDQIHTAIL